MTVQLHPSIDNRDTNPTGLSCGRFFAELGQRTNGLWHSMGCDERVFHEAATRALLELPPQKHVRIWDAIAYGCLADPLPLQKDLDGKFGQPPLTVYWQDEFRIELLFWVHALPAIHQHSFSGAFHVLHGSSLHSIWDFDCRETITTRLLYGDLTLSSANVLNAGSTHGILGGNRFIHSTYHLDRPTVSVVVRTNHEQHHSPQYSYLPPTIAYDQPNEGPTTIRRLQFLNMLGGLGRFTELVDIVEQILEGADTYSAFQCLMQAFKLLQEERDRNRVLTAALRRHGRLVEVLRPVLEAIDRRDRIISLRRSVTDPDLQFFLALMLNVSVGPVILHLISQRYRRGDAIEMICRWVRELSSVRLADLLLPEYWQEIIRAGMSDTGAAAVPCANWAGSREYLFGHWLLAPLFAGSCASFA